MHVLEEKCVKSVSFQLKRLENILVTAAKQIPQNTAAGGVNTCHLLQFLRVKNWGWLSWGFWFPQLGLHTPRAQLGWGACFQVGTNSLQSSPLKSVKTRFMAYHTTEGS